MTLCQLLSIGHSVTTSLDVANGLGQHIGSLSTHKVEQWQKVRGTSSSTANATDISSREMLTFTRVPMPAASSLSAF